jgi:hypothetical protein
MTTRKRITAIVLWGLALVLSGCIVVPREGYYDRDHHRYWHGNGWHGCGDRDEHCRYR